ncbi:MAG TPA: AIPR family protein [Candidatus Pacearchaeota archaeon]|nr:AIPR family protein [Candidatus Pacearchaeota archaeon]
MNTNQKFSFNVSSFRHQHETADGRKLCVFTVPVGNVPNEWSEWREVNVRDTQKRSDVFNAIVDTLKNNPEEMIFRNLGITIVAPSVEFNNKTNTVTVTFADKNKHGIANGGHTFEAIQQALSEGSIDGALVKVECITGEIEHDWLRGIVDGRNRSRAVKDESLENLARSYDSIKNVLTDPLYKDRIAYSEFELNENNRKKDISIREILSYIYCLDQFDRNTHPIEAYSSKGAVVEYYAGIDEKGQKRTYVIEKASKILSNIVRLRDIIYQELPQAYNGSGLAFGKNTTMGIVTNEDNPRPLRFIKGTARWTYPDAFIYPILAAFRKYIDHRGWKWTQDPFDVWRNKKNDVAATLKDAFGTYQSPNKMGKATLAWRTFYDVI